MQITEHFCLMAQYNEWINTKIYETASKLSAQELSKNRGAFFGSILGTLNHIAVGRYHLVKTVCSAVTNLRRIKLHSRAELALVIG